MFVFVQFDISGVAADEVMTGEIYSLSFGGWISKSLLPVVLRQVES